MFVIGNILFTLAQIISTLLNLYSYVLIAAVILTWVNPDPYNVIVRTLRALTEPLFYQVRKYLPFTMAGGFDFSPIVVLIIIQFINGAVIKSIMQFAIRLQY